jgi:hypothetical protein
MTKKSWWTAAAVVALCALLALALVLPPGPGVTKANFDQIDERMSLEDLNTLLGSPPDRVQVRRRPDVKKDPPDLKKDPPEVCYTWIGDEGIVSVCFAKKPQFTHKEWKEQPRSFFQQVRGWLHLR